MTTDEAAILLNDARAYADEARFGTACARLRAVAPVVRVESAGFAPFRALTEHEGDVPVRGARPAR